MSRPLNIAIFTGTFTPQINGVVTSTLTLIDELKKLGHNVLTLAPKMSGAEPSNDEVWRLNSIPYPFQPEHRIVSPLSLKLSTFKSLNIDVIHIQTPFLMGHLGQYLSWKHTIPMIHTYHTLWLEYLYYFPLLPEKYRKNINHLFTRNFCNRCDHIICPSSAIYDHLTDQKIHKPIDIIPTGINREKLTQDTNPQEIIARYGLDPVDKIIIFVGRLGKEKNIYFLLDAAAPLLKTVPKTKLMLIGDGPERQSLEEKCAQLDIQSQVVFTGYLNQKDVFSAYQAAHVIGFPSKTETQGLSLLEGLSLGCPAVGINEMGVIDILKDNRGGILVPDDEAVFREALQKMLTDSKYHAEKKKEAYQIGEDFSSTKITKKIVEIYNKLVNERMTQS